MNIAMLFGLVGGLGLFLYGMERMATGLQRAAGDKLRHIIELVTSHPVIAVITGAVTTILVQSSSTTTVMIVGFVNAGLMTLHQAVGTIMGANIGTTITAQLVSFKIYELALPAVAVGFIMNYASKKRFKKYAGQALLGFGLLLLGMMTMSDAVSPLRDYPPFINLLVSMGQYPLLGVLAGTVFTVLVQSSSATTGLVIAFTLQDLINLPAGLSLILGANLGTCITALLASIGANITARRAAIAHITFNVFGVVLFLILLRPFTYLVTLTGESVTRQVANAHTIFNVVNTILLLPFLNQFVKVVTRLVPGEAEVLERKPKYLDLRILNTPAAIISARKETLRMADLSAEMLQDAISAFIRDDEKLIASVLEKEEILNDLEKSITAYLSQAAQNPIVSRQSSSITALMHVVHDIERVGDHSTNICELAHEKITHSLKFSDQAYDELVVMYNEVLKIYKKSIEFMRDEKANEAELLLREDELIDRLEQQYRQTHIERLNEGKCHPESGVIFLDLISNLERIADHANNVAEAVSGFFDDSEEELVG